MPLKSLIMKQKPKLLLLLIPLFVPMLAWAQAVTVTGKVISGDDGKGLPGVTIQIKGTTQGAISDLDGNYSLSADPKGTLIFSYMGYKTIEMNFLPDVMVPCEVCHGKRYNRETLEVRFKGKSIADVLDMTVNMAVEFFENVPQILPKIKALQDVGLGYIKLGQSSTTLSGGESQRVKLATELAKRDTGKTLYILDEPTTGLHFEDIRILMDVLQKLVDRGNTVIIIEHNLDVIKLADYIIDMGPEGGRGGGRMLSCGTPEVVAKNKESYTSRFLTKVLK